MIFDPFEWPPVPENLSVEVDTNTWQVLRSSRGALRSPDVKTLGWWCQLKDKPLYLYHEKSDLILHYNGKTSRIPKLSKTFHVRERSFILWRSFTLKKGNEIILTCFYRDPDTLLVSILKAFAFDDQFWKTPFHVIKEQLNDHSEPFLHEPPS